MAKVIVKANDTTKKVKEKDAKVELTENEVLKAENKEIKEELSAIGNLLKELMAKENNTDKPEKVEEKVEEAVNINEFDELQDIHTRYRVKVTSLYNGGLNLRGLNREVRFDRFGQTKILYFEDVEAMTSNNESFFRQGLVFIHDHRVLKLIYLEDAYEKFIEPETLKRIFELPVSEIRSLYKNTTKDLQKEILHTFAEWINRNDPYYLDKNKIDVINEVSGKDVKKIAESLKEYSAE